MTQQVRVRFAPSPTGFLHVGGARTALFNWLWARKNNGTFVLRIEDTDMERSTDESTAQIFESLKWLGLEWDEGPYYQSQRMDIYRAHLDKLRDAGKIYPAFETREELDEMRKEAEATGRSAVYDRRSLKLPAEEVQRRLDSGEPFVWRFKTPNEGVTEVPETLLSTDGVTTFQNSDIDDFILTRPGTLAEPGVPLYNFVCTVDDAVMEITHVIRGADHLQNTAKQVLLYQAMGYPVPTFTHLPLIMKNKKKMSKRDADADPMTPVSVSARRDLGYLREATVNFLALLGWSFPGDREIFPVEDLIENFTLDRLQKSNANFDEDKYLHQNATYIRSLPLEDIVERTKPFLDAAGYDYRAHGDEWLARAISLEVERRRLLSEFAPALDYYFEAPAAYEAKGVKKAFKEDTAPMLRAVAEVLEAAPQFEKEVLEVGLRAYGEENGFGFGKIAQPVRLAVTGRTATPGLFDVLELLGKEETVARVRRAADVIESGDIPQN